MNDMNRNMVPAWLAANGVNPDQVVMRPITFTDTPDAPTFTYHTIATDADGNYLIGGHELLYHAHTVPLTVPPPPELRAALDIYATDHGLRETGRVEGREEFAARLRSAFVTDGVGADGDALPWVRTALRIIDRVVEEPATHWTPPEPTAVAQRVAEYPTQKDMGADVVYYALRALTVGHAAFDQILWDARLHVLSFRCSGIGDHINLWLNADGPDGHHSERNGGPAAGSEILWEIGQRVAADDGSTRFEFTIPGTTVREPEVVGRLRALCATHQAPSRRGEPTDAECLWPSQILAILDNTDSSTTEAS